jgi:phage terminase large subunit GpA-like protein
MVQAGRWRATKPDVQGHAGFRLNALVSVLPNASWAKLAAEILQAKSDPVQLQVFTNTILAQAWDEAESLDEMDLITKVIPIGLDRMPDVAIVLVAGIDVQDDRLEISLVAFDKHDVAYILAHIVLFGSPDDDTLWQELDELLRTRWRHPYGGSIGVDACAIDSGDGDWTQRCYDFCFPRTSRRVMAIKGMFGSRPVMQRSKGKVGTRKDGRGGGFIWIAGVDVIKTTLFNRLQRGQMIKFSDTLEPVYFEQLASEKVVVRYSRGQPVRRFERVSGRARAESLDCLVYSFAARKAVPVQWTAREAALRGGGTVQRGSMGQKLYDSTQGSKYPIRGL